MAGHEWEDWFEREEFIGQISDIRVQNLQVEREVVQKRTFTRWMNLHLEKCNPPIEVHDLFRDIQDGRILMALLEELSGCKLLHGFKKSSHRIFRLNNIAKVLSFLEERNVKLVSIDAADVADGNSSIILGLIWNIILFFQIKELTGNIRSRYPSSSSLTSIPTSSDSDMSYCSTPSEERQSASTAMREHSKAIKKLLQWVQKQTRKYGVAVQDFAKSWTSGLAFLAVIKSIDHSLVDMRKALLRSPRENMEDAFRIAHYSLGIPRLLEPEDVTINAPDEQCIITYVSQFLEHFPGLEEPEEPCHVIERSVSMGRLNFRDSDYYIRNSAHQSRVRERSYMFQKDNGQLPPKILISSVSEDRSAMSPSFRSATARSWSSEDFLVNSPHTEDISSKMHEDTKEPVSEVMATSTSNSPQLSDTYSPTGSLVPDSVIGDSAINSPDSWESEFGVMPEKFCESRSDSSLCDSETVWDVYRATPVEITHIDEGFFPFIEDKGPDQQLITESYIDEGICSLSSLESTQGGLQGHSEKKQIEAVKEKDIKYESHNQHMVPYQSETEIIKEAGSKPMCTNLQEDELPRDQEGLANSDAKDLLETDKTKQSQLTSSNELPLSDHFEELIKQTSAEESTDRDPEKTVDLTGDALDHARQINGQTKCLNGRNNSEDVEVENECQKTDPPLDDKRVDTKNISGILKEMDENIVMTPDKAKVGFLTDCPDHQKTICKESIDATTHPNKQKGAFNNSLESSRGTNIPLISIFSETEEQGEERTSDSERQTHPGDEEVHQPEVPESTGTDTDTNSPQSPDELTCDSSDNEGRSPFVTVDTSNLQTTDNVEISEPKQASKLPYLYNSLTYNTDQNFTTQTPSIDVKSQPVKTKQEIHDYAFSQKETTSTQQNAPHPVDTDSNGRTGILCYEPARVPRHISLFHADFDQSSPTDDLVGEPVEPMDLFYPYKEEPMFTEPPDTEMQSWPSVLSVSALQPAPASETLPDDLPLNLLHEDFGNKVDLIQENKKVITKTNRETDKAPDSQEQCLLSGTNTGGLWSDDIPADSGDLSEPEQQSPGSSSENIVCMRYNIRSSSRQDESQFPTILRQRKGTRFTESIDSQRGVTAATRKADNADFWCSENWELHLLLLLWLLLYCFWVLPQMDLKTLPSQLLNLNH
ncbi:calmin [Channa argus]|uniref:calmin n=1 Tax=Channa argus TaxID=215402 RepID=UPI0035209AD4